MRECSFWLDELISYWAVDGDGLGSVFSRDIHCHKASTQTIVIGFPCLKKRTKYHQYVIDETIHDGDTFWLFAHSNESYVNKFREWLETKLGEGTLEELEKKEYGLFQLRKYRLKKSK